MIQKRQKILLLLTMLLLVGAFVWLSSQAYRLYQAHENTRDNLSITSYIENTHRLLVDLDHEEQESALYMATAGETAKLIARRKQTDGSLQKLRALAVRSSQLQVFAPFLNQMEESIGFARSKVDTLNAEAGRVFYENYYQAVSHALTDSIAKKTLFFQSADVDGLLEHSVLIGANYASVSLEKNFILFSMLSNSPMNLLQLSQWEMIIDNNARPDLSGINDVQLLGKLNQLVSDPKIEKALSDGRIAFVTDVAEGRQSSLTGQWKQISQSKLTHLHKAGTLLLTLYRDDMVKNSQRLQRQMTIYIIGSLLTLAFLLVVTWVYRAIQKETLILEETLKDIEFDLDRQKKEELLRIIEQGDTRNTYTFFAETIREANRIKDLFLANMSHEIRTPLNGIVGFTQMLKTASTDADREEYIHVIEESSEHLLNIVNDILDLSKIKADKIELEEIAFDPLDKLESAVEAYGAKAFQKEIEFGVYVDPRLPRSILGDPTRLSQVVVNLIGNAIKFTSTRGEVNFYCERIKDDGEEVTIRFSVRDTGIGISEEQQDKIFEAFSQADISTTRKFGGTGLGLSISNKLVSVMGGKLELDSVPGEGSLFYFTLTFKHDGSAKPREEHAYDTIKAGMLLPNRDVDRQVDKNLMLFLKHMHMDLTTVYEEEVYNLPGEALPDILFVDHRYSQRDGEIERILGLETGIVLLTASSINARLSALNDRFVSIVHKPFNYSKALRVIQTYAGERDKPEEKSEEESLFDDLHILVAEDNTINQKLIITALESFGIHVTVASHGEEAVSLRRHNDYDLIFMDIQMPVMNGLEATQEILHYERINQLKHIPIVALTANALKGDREKYLKAGMDNYTPKPINIGHIKDIIRQYHPEKERVVEVKVVKEPEAEPQPPVVLAAKDRALLYFTNTLVQSIHYHMLENIVECTFVDNEADFFLGLDEGTYSLAVLDATLLPRDACYFADLIKKKDVKLYAFGEDKNLKCEMIINYETIRKLKEKLQKEQEDHTPANM